MHINKFIKKCEENCKQEFEKIDEICEFNQEKTLNAFKKNRVALRHFSQTTGYGYDDIGRDTLARVFADTFGAESAIVSPLLASGTHTLTVMLFALLRPGDTLYCISGMPYDTLHQVLIGENNGSLKDYNINFVKSDLLSNGDFDIKAIEKYLKNNKPKIIYLQRSRGYSWREAHCISDLENIISFVKKFSPNSIIAVDNCYGEFVEKLEPVQIGADIMAGSLIKNPGGGLASSGGYIAGKISLVEQVGYRLTAPGVGLEVGSYNAGYKEYYQGFFLASHITAQALKGAILVGEVFNSLGYETLPKKDTTYTDIIRAVKFNNKDELIKFCQNVQSYSPVDSYVTPYPWAMPGYTDEVIMAAGTFIQGASIELSADAPIKEPYIGYMQGGLTYEHVKIMIKGFLKENFFERLI